MTRQLTQNKAADLVAILTDTNNSPQTGLVYTDVVVEYRKEGGVFTSKSLDPTSASVTSSNAELYSLVDGQTLLVSVDGGAAQTATFNTADFVDISNATAAEVAAVITTDIAGATSVDVGGFVVITAASIGESSSIQVTGGTSNVVLGFDTAEESGSTFFKEIGSGVYEIEFTDDELNTLGSFTYKVNGATIAQYVEIAEIVSEGGVSVPISIDTCVISGYVFGVDGAPMVNVTVSAKVLGAPAAIGSVGLVDSRAVAITDSNGEFFLELARQAFVEVVIPKMRYRRQLTVPNQASAVLFEIP